MMRLLAVSGSLQARSSNGALLNALVDAFGKDTQTTFTRALHELPPFNTDLDTDTPPPSVLAWRAELASADAVLFATPEYAFGIAGALKNSLDWVVGSGELVHKPVLILAASTMETGASWAREALERTLRVMSADVVGVLGIPFVRAKVDPTGAVVDDELRATLGELAQRMRDKLAKAGV